jgi:uncharacterized 2Fe-2S/4Fe-4S cluster protein (DUF4445 family)
MGELDDGFLTRAGPAFEGGHVSNGKLAHDFMILRLNDKEVRVVKP